MKERMTRRLFLSSPIALLATRLKLFGEDEKPDKIPMKDELRDKYQAAYFRAMSDNANLQLMVDSFIKQNPTAAEFQADLNAQQNEVNRLAALAYHEHDLKPEDYTINPKTATFEKIAKESK